MAPVIARGFRQLLGSYHLGMNKAFSSYGSFVARRPLIPLVIGLLLLGGLSLGLIKGKKESDLEKLWVEHNSRVVEERRFFNDRFGGISRKEVVTVSSVASANDQVDLKKSMEALTLAIAPLYDALSLTKTVGNTTHYLTNTDFCERPLVPTSLKPGSNPLLENNWVSWGLQYVSTCTIDSVYGSQSNHSFALPPGWGIKKFPCTKVTPMDCFKEGGDFDYPEELKQLEKPVPGSNLTLIDLIAGFARQSKLACFSLLQKNISDMFSAINYPNSSVPQIVGEVEAFMGVAYTWGYRWRKPYTAMNSNQEILDHINEAIGFARQMSPDPTKSQTLACVTEKLPCCLTWFGAHTPILASFGGVQRDPSGTNITKIEAIRWGSNNYNQGHPLFSEYMNSKLGTNYNVGELEDLAKEWEQVMIDHLDPLRQRQSHTAFGQGKENGDLQVEFNMWRSSQDIIKDSGKTPIWQISLSIILTTLYATVVFANIRDPVHSHVWLATTGLGVVTLAIIAGFGLTALCGISFSPLAIAVVPFLTLGLGIDDVFVLVNILRNFLEDPKLQAMNTLGDLVPERELRLTLALAGPSVVLTTFSVLASFFISSLNPMPLAQWFCWQMGITASMHTLGMLLIFMPIMAIDASRVKAQWNDPTLWLIFGRHKEGLAPHGTSAGTAQVKKPMLSDMKQFDVSDPIFQDTTGSTIISRWIAKYYAPLFESNIFKLTVVAVFAALLVSMTYLGFKKVDHGLRLSDVTLTGSYQNTFARLTEDRFLSYDLWIVTHDIDMASQQSNVLEVFDALQNLTVWAPPQPRVLESSFLGNLYLWDNITQLSEWPISPNQTLFYGLEKPWSSSPLGIFSLQDLYCEDASTSERVSCFVDVGVPANPNFRIGATKTMMFAENLGSQVNANVDMIKTTRKTVDDLNTKFGQKVAYMYGYPYLFFEQYLHSYHDLYLVVGLALVGVFVAVLIFQFSITMSLVIALVLLMIDLEVYGFLYIIGAKLNSLSLVNLGIVIGMASELTYLARSFLVVDGTRNHRVGKALEWTFEPLLHGFGTQFAATLPLVFVKYHAFRLYYFGMFTIMGILAFLNGFVLLPVILSWLGPAPLPHIRGPIYVGQGDEKIESANGASPFHGGQTPMIHHNGNSATLDHKGLDVEEGTVSRTLSF